MSVSYGTITITDSTDLGQLTAYITANNYKQQTLDTNTGSDVYYPNWLENGGTLLLTPNIFYNGSKVVVYDTQTETLNSKVSITWYENDVNISSNQSSTANVTNKLECSRHANLGIGNRSAIYRAEIKYYPFTLANGQRDQSLFLVASAEIELSLTTTGKNADEPKSLQLTTNKGYFTYRYTDEVYGGNTATITATRSSTVKGIAWYYINASGTETALPNSFVTNGGNSSQYTGSSITISTTNAWQSTLFGVLTNRGQITFIVKETTSNGGTTLVSNGFTDSVSIMYYKEASPGESVYISSLDNNEETLSVYNNILDLTSAYSRLYINKDGKNDIDNWHISLSDNIVGNADFTYLGWNSKDYPNGTYKGISSTTITENQANAPTINGTVIPTNTLATNDLVIYGTNIFCWNGSKWTKKTTNYTKFGPDCVAVTSMTVNRANITFLAEHGVYDGNGNFARDDKAADLRNTFTVGKSSSIISHALRLDTVNINRDASGNYTPATVTLDAITRTGGSSAQTSYRDAGVIKYKINYATGNPSTGENAPGEAISLTLPLPNETREITLIEVKLGNSSIDSDGPWEDTQTISVSNDGTSPFNISVPNQTDTISTTFEYKPNADFVIDVPFLVMHGFDEVNLHKYVNTSTSYPRVKVGAIYKVKNNTATSTGITPAFYNNNSTATDITNKVKATLSRSTDIGNNGYFDLTFELSATISKVVRYTYTSVPEALSPISAQLQLTPGNTFVNQSGKILIEPIVNSGATLITTNLTYLWQIYDGTWKTIRNTSTGVSTDYYNEGIFFSNSASSTSAPSNISNGTANSKFLHVKGTAVNSYAAIRLTVNYPSKQQQVIEYVSLVDKSDPIQITILSTVGDKLTNGQGTGALYVRTIMNQDELDSINTPLMFTNTAPTATGANPDDYAGMLGCIVKTTNNNVINLDYYYRTSLNGTWQGPRNSTRCVYEWSFRNQDNEPILASDSGINSYLKHVLTGGTDGKPLNTQFIYIDRNIVNNKLTADVKVTVNPIEE